MNVYKMSTDAGELIFLLWGIKVCIAVRKARTYFDEATLISWSIYNIAAVNCIMAAIQWVHQQSVSQTREAEKIKSFFNLSVLILPNCGPDVKYFLAFMRTQLSTTTTMILVFGPKVQRMWSQKMKIFLSSVSACCAGDRGWSRWTEQKMAAQLDGN